MFVRACLIGLLIAAGCCVGWGYSVWSCHKNIFCRSEAQTDRSLPLKATENQDQGNDLAAYLTDQKNQNAGLDQIIAYLQGQGAICSVESIRENEPRGDAQNVHVCSYTKILFPGDLEWRVILTPRGAGWDFAIRRFYQSL